MLLTKRTKSGDKADSVLSYTVEHGQDLVT